MWRTIRKAIKNSIRLKIAVKRNKPYETKQNTNVPTINSNEDVINEIINNKKSLVRYGDGELGICLYPNKYINYQAAKPELVKRLKEILATPTENVIVGIPDIFANLGHFRNTNSIVNISGKQFWQLYLTKNNRRQDIYKLLNFKMQYADSFITRPYMAFADKSKTEKKFEQLKTIWDQRHVIIIEGEFSRLGMGNDLFNNAKSIKRILGPATNAFDRIDEIIAECNKQSKDTLFLLALGQTATVLGSDLAQLGYQAIDIGHIDIEYEWFKQKATTKIAVANKYTYEANNGKNADRLKLLKNEEYESQIIAKIL